MATVHKVERLLSLINVLLGAPGAIRAEDLRDRVPGYPAEDASFKRAFERDKDELRDMGVPLLVELVPGSDPPVQGYRIRPQDYELNDPGLDPDELEALDLAAAVTGFAGGVSQGALFKLGASAPERAAVELPTDPALVGAFRAVAERRTMAFRYHDLRRELRPYRLEFARGRWYVNGFDQMRGDDRWFRLDRIDGEVEVGSETAAFEQPVEAVPGLTLDPWVLGGEEQPLQAEVWFDPAVSHTVRRQVPPEAIVQDDEVGLVVRLTVTNRDGFRSWVLAYLDRAEVRAPQELREELVSWLEKLVPGVRPS